MTTARWTVTAGSLVAVLTIVLSGCSNAPRSDDTPPSTQTAPAEGIRSQLSHLDGTYDWNPELKRFVFSNKAAIENLVGAGSDRIIDDLVDCLDDSGPSHTTLNGQAVPTGVVCHEALKQLVYYEPIAADGDIAASWPGHVEPTATGEQLRASKRAWREVIEKKSFKRL